MARIIKKICFMTIVFLVAISIKVYANELTLECQESINPETENTIEYVLKGNFTDNVNSIKVRYTIPDGVEFQGFTPSGAWNLEQGGTSDTTGFVLRISDGDVNGEIEFGKFTFNVPSTYDKENVAFKIYGLDATNTSCEIVEFSQDEVNSIPTENQDDNNLNDNQDDENNNPSDDNNNNDDNGETEEKENINTNIGNASAGSKNNNSLNAKSDTKEDTTVTKTPFGQYGNGKIITIVIALVSITGLIFYKKFKKFKYIK